MKNAAEKREDRKILSNAIPFDDFQYFCKATKFICRGGRVRHNPDIKSKQLRVRRSSLSSVDKPLSMHQDTKTIFTLMMLRIKSNDESTTLSLLYSPTFLGLYVIDCAKVIIIWSFGLRSLRAKKCSWRSGRSEEEITDHSLES